MAFKRPGVRSPSAPPDFINKKGWLRKVTPLFLYHQTVTSFKDLKLFIINSHWATKRLFQSPQEMKLSLLYDRFNKMEDFEYGQGI
jgi:hypothetical protein